MEESLVYTKVERPTPNQVEAASQHSVADLLESVTAIDGFAELMNPDMRPVDARLAVTGPAVTVRHAPGDNSMIYTALHVAQQGDVLVFSSGGAPQCPQWGDVSATEAIHKGIAGVIVDGSIRDTAFHIEHRFPVWSTAISASHTAKSRPGAVNVPIVCSGAGVRPGDLVSADGDGVLVIPRSRIDAAVAGALDRQRTEARLRQAIRDGRSLFDLHNHAELLQSLGVRVVEAAWPGER